MTLNEKLQNCIKVYYGAGSFVRTICDAGCEEYQELIDVFRNKGFKEHSDNGPEGLYQKVFVTNMVRGNETATITLQILTQILTVSENPELSFSDHMVPEYSDPVTECIYEHTVRLYMRELWHYGNCFVVRLGNGHFLLIDTGKKEDGPYLIDFLRDQSPDDHPVIDGIFVSHCHRDHAGFFRYLIENPCMADVVKVNGVYFNEPKDSVKAINPYSFQAAAWIREASLLLRSEKNCIPEIYRPQTGQRYYFRGVIAEILLAQEQVPRETYARDVNDSSTWIMLRISDQKIMLPGDGDKGCIKAVCSIYDRENLKVTAMSLMHHGFNTRFDFSRFVSVQTMLCSIRDRAPARRIRENMYLKKHVKEWITYGEGTVEIKFPYNCGTFLRHAPLLWQYNVCEERPEQPNLDTLPQINGFYIEKSLPQEIRERIKEVLEPYGECIDDPAGLKISIKEDGNFLKDDQLMFEPLDYGWEIHMSSFRKIETAVSCFMKYVTWTGGIMDVDPPEGIISSKGKKL